MKKEKDNEIMREEREEPNIKKQYFVIPLCYSVVLPLGQYCSTMAKNLHFYMFPCPVVELLWASHAKFSLHLSYPRPIVNALRIFIFCFSRVSNFFTNFFTSYTPSFEKVFIRLISSS